MQGYSRSVITIFVDCDVVAGHAQISRFESQARIEAELSEIDGVHQVAGGYALEKVKVIRVVVQVSGVRVDAE